MYSYHFIQRDYTLFGFFIPHFFIPHFTSSVLHPNTKSGSGLLIKRTRRKQTLLLSILSSDDAAAWISPSGCLSLMSFDEQHKYQHNKVWKPDL